MSLNVVFAAGHSNMDVFNQPLLLMVGTKADSLYMTESALNYVSG